MKNDIQNSNNSATAKGALSDTAAPKNDAKKADHGLAAKSGPEVALKTADPVVAKKS